MSDTAVRPDVFLSFQEIGEDKRTPEDKKKEKDPDDIALHSMATTRGWGVLKNYIEYLKKEMDGLIESLIANGGSFEEVGKITVVSNLAKDKLNDIIRRVQDSQEAVEN